MNYRFLPLGDSYTICEGADISDSWPSLLTKNIQKTYLDFEIIGNPAVSGWTTQDLIYKELPVFDSFKPNFVTLLIGVNDWVQEVPISKFKTNFEYIINHVLYHLNSERKLLLITIPDFSAAPDGEKYSKGRNISKGINEFNEQVFQLANSYKLEVADIFEASQMMRFDSTLVAKDNLHGSAKMYAIWEEIIRNKVLKII